MLIADNFEAVKRRVSELQTKKDTKVGALKEKMKRLRKLLGAKTVKEAQEVLNRLMDERAKIAKECISDLKQLKKKYPKAFEGL